MLDYLPKSMFDQADMRPISLTKNWCSKIVQVYQSQNLHFIDSGKTFKQKQIDKVNFGTLYVAPCMKGLHSCTDKRNMLTHMLRSALLTRESADGCCICHLHHSMICMAAPNLEQVSNLHGLLDAVPRTHIKILACALQTSISCANVMKHSMGFRLFHYFVSQLLPNPYTSNGARTEAITRQAHRRQQFWIRPHLQSAFAESCKVLQSDGGCLGLWLRHCCLNRLGCWLCHGLHGNLHICMTSVTLSHSPKG